MGIDSSLHSRARKGSTSAFRLLIREAKGPHDLYFRGDGGIGGIHHSHRGFAAFDQRQGGADILGARHATLDGGPRPKAFKGLKAVYTGGHMVGIAHGESAAANELRQVKSRCDPDPVECGVSGSDQDDAVAKQVDTCSTCDHLFLFEIVHPLPIIFVHENHSIISGFKKTQADRGRHRLLK